LRRGDADVDLLRVCARIAKHAWRDEMVVEHHVGGLETVAPAHGDEPRVTGAGADEMNGRHGGTSRRHVSAVGGSAADVHRRNCTCGILDSTAFRALSLPSDRQRRVRTMRRSYG